MMARIGILAAIAVALAAPAASAQQSARGAPVSDPLFAQAAMSGGLAEVSIGELGAQRATDPELKKFSQQMIDDHARVNQQIVNLAAQKRVALPRAPEFCAQFCAQSLAGLSGEQFDHCFAKAVLATHMETVAAYEAEAERGQDPAWRKLASDNLPRIKEHLKTIKQLAQKHMKETDKETRPGG
jgi:putative membrane protein